jgi:hypothetical protein
MSLPSAFTVFQRHQAGVLPVGDVDLVVTQHGFDGVTQQGGVVARQGGHNQYRRLVFQFCQGCGVIRITLETQQFAKWLFNFDTFMNGHVHTAYVHGADAKLWFFVIFAQAVKQVIACGHALGHGVLAGQAVVIAVKLGCRLRHAGKGLHKRALSFVNLIKHGQASLNCCAAAI